MQRFEDILAWEQAKELTILIYKIFNNCRDYGFKDQLQRASVSIMNNIAEGFERKSDRELRYFLYIAKGSCGEVRSMLAVAPEVGHITQSQQAELTGLAVSVSRLLAGFIKRL